MRKTCYLFIQTFILAIVLSFTLSVYASASSQPQGNELQTPQHIIANQYAELYKSNLEHGTFDVRFVGDAEGKRVKLQTLTQSGNVYSYNLNANGETSTIPLSEGSGHYMVKVYVQIEGSTYQEVFITYLSAKMADELEPFRHPNYYVSYTSDSNTAETACKLTKYANGSAAKIDAVYAFVRGFAYDQKAAEAVEPWYVPELDAVIAAKRGICLDFAATMTALLRCSGVPAKLVFGCAGEAYHAWVEVYSYENAILSGGVTLQKGWNRLDPTFARYEVDSSVWSYVSNDEGYLPLYYY